MRWNTIAAQNDLPQVKKTTSKSRSQKLAVRIQEGLTVEVLEQIGIEIAQSDLLRGLKNNWKITFDWILNNDSNWVKVIEGNYRNTSQQQAPPRETAAERRNARLEAQAERMMNKYGGETNGSEQETNVDARVVEATEILPD